MLFYLCLLLVAMFVVFYGAFYLSQEIYYGLYLRVLVGFLLAMFFHVGSGSILWLLLF